MDNSIDNLSISVTASAEGAIRMFDRLASSASKLKGASHGAAGGMKDVATEAKDAGTATAHAGEQIERTSGSCRRFWDMIKRGVSGTSMFKNVLRDIFSATKQLGGAVLGVAKQLGGRFVDSVKQSVKGINSFLSSIKRIVFYRAIRSAIREITQGFSEGIKNLYNWSNAVNGHFAASMDRLATSSLYLKNSFAAMASPLIEALVPAIDFIIDKFVDLFNIINQVFARLSGRTSYTAAKKVATQWGDAAKSASGSAKKAADDIKRTILGFDEINKLNDNNKSSGSGGGGGGSSGLSGAMMFENRPISSWIQEMVDGGDFSILGAKIADKINSALSGINWESIRKRASHITTSITSLINGFIETIDPNILGKSLAEVINTATTTIDQFWSGIKWAIAGMKIRKAIVQFFKDIDVESAADALLDPFRSLATLIFNAIPNDESEWKIIGFKITRFINRAVSNIPFDTIGATIGRVIVGAMNIMQILAEQNTLTNIANGIKTAIQTACEQITPEQVSGWVSSVMKDVLSAVGILLTFDLKFGDIKVSPIEIIAFGALAKSTITGLLTKFFGSVGVGANGLFNCAISVGLGVTLLAKAFTLAKAAGEDGKITLQEMCDIVGTGLMGIGAALLGVHPVAGAIVASVGLVIKLIPSFDIDTVRNIGQKIKGIKESVQQGFNIILGKESGGYGRSDAINDYTIPMEALTTDEIYGQKGAGISRSSRIASALTEIDTTSQKLLSGVVKRSENTASAIEKTFVGNNGLKDKIVTGTKDLSKAVSKNSASATSTMVTKFNSASAATSTSMNTLQTSVSDALAKTNANATKEAASILARITAMDTGISTNTTKTFTQVSSTIGTSATTSSRNISNMATSMTGSMNSANRGVTGSMTSLGNTLVSESNGISWNVSNSFGWIASTIVSCIIGARNQAGSVSFYDIGANIVNGIYNGIMNGWNWLNNTISNLARSLFNAAKWVLGIRSPSRVFRDQVGKMIGLGWAEGIMDAEPYAMKSIADFSDSLMEQLNRSSMIPNMEAVAARAYAGIPDYGDVISTLNVNSESANDNGADPAIALLQSLLQEMRQFNEKEFTAEVTTASITRAMNRTNRRAGTTVIPIGT